MIHIIDLLELLASNLGADSVHGSSGFLGLYDGALYILLLAMTNAVILIIAAMIGNPYKRLGDIYLGLLFLQGLLCICPILLMIRGLTQGLPISLEYFGMPILHFIFGLGLVSIQYRYRVKLIKEC